MTELLIAGTVGSMITRSPAGFFTAVAYWCARALQVQLFLTLVSLPILVGWGLPMSCMSPLGNCLFTPFLTLFLLLSSIMFFSQLLHIPYAPVAWAFNQVGQLWLFVMNYGSRQWLFGIVRLPLPLLLAIGLAPFLIVAYKPTRSLFVSTSCFLSLLLVIYGYSSFVMHTTSIITIPCGRGELTLITTPQATVLVDPGYLGSLVGARSWVRYRLIPELVSSTGRTHIDHLILLQPMGLGFEAAQELCTSLRVDTVWLPSWQGFLKRSHSVRYAVFKKNLACTGTALMRIDTAPHVVTLSDQATIIITPCATWLQAGTTRFRVQKLEAQIDNSEVTIYSAKYKLSNIQKQLQEKNPTKK